MRGGKLPKKVVPELFGVYSKSSFFFVLLGVFFFGLDFFSYVNFAIF